MAFSLPPLPYAQDALEPVMSAETLAFHHGKHHQAYVDGTNRILEEKPDAAGRLSDVIRAAAAAGGGKLFNQSAQIWNHSFYWQCLAPAGAQRPTGKLSALIEDSFGTTDDLIEALKKDAVGHFSNGWAWLVLNRDKLEIVSLHDADTPVAREGMKPLLTLDVWEHAYYIDYRNARADFADKVLTQIVNWEFVAQNLDGQGVERADQDWS
jgi:Fe-Mn family superoxide dismutase